MATKKIQAAAPIVKTGRRVAIPATVGAQDTTRNDAIAAGKQRVNFRNDEFERVLKQHGKTIVWRKAIECPCRSPETSNPAVNCAVCGANGYIYIHPLEIQAHMVMFDKKTSLYDKIGLWESGSVNVTVSAGYRMGYRDSLEMADAVMPFTETIVKGDRRGLRSRLPEGHDSARFRIRNLTVAVVLQGATTLFLEPGLHVLVSPDGWLQWTKAGHALVSDGDRVSLHYDYAPIFLVQSHTHITRTDLVSRKQAPGQPLVVALPNQCMAKLSYLLDVNEYMPSMLQDVAAAPSGIA